VSFRGELLDLPAQLAGVALYYRWYSSLLDPGAAGQLYAASPALTEAGAVFSPGGPLPMGSHVITFAASDRAGESDADLEAIAHGGVSGGSEGDNRCLIHVFKANILAPTADDAPRAGLSLEAEAPLLWGSKIEGSDSPEYEPNGDYHAYNRLRYRWRFEPVGPPADRPTVEYAPDPAAVAFDPATDPVRVSYSPTPPLPATATGSYRILLYVEDALDAGIGQHQDEVTVDLT
jgi:hypothetical protein